MNSTIKDYFKINSTCKFRKDIERKRNLNMELPVNKAKIVKVEEEYPISILSSSDDEDNVCKIPLNSFGSQAKSDPSHSINYNNSEDVETSINSSKKVIKTDQPPSISNLNLVQELSSSNQEKVYLKTKDFCKIKSDTSLNKTKKVDKKCNSTVEIIEHHVDIIQVKTEDSVINLSSSEDEDNVVEIPLNTISSQTYSDSFHSIDTNCVLEKTPRTKSRTKSPKSKSPKSKSPKSKSPKSKSPKSKSPKSKSYSPIKKRLIRVTTPAKRVLFQRALSSSLMECEDKNFIEAFEGLCDKTVFLLRIIYEFFKGESTLQDLLCQSTKSLLIKTFQVAKPGMGLVCRLYWWKDLWYRRDKLDNVFDAKDKKILNNDNNKFEMMLQSLITSGYLEKHSPGDLKLSLEEYIDILKLDDLKRRGKELKLNFKNKQEALKVFKDFARNKNSISNWIKGERADNSERLLKILSETVGFCYRLSPLARDSLYRLYVLMYLGIDYSIIRDNKLEFVIINDKVKKEEFPVDKDMKLDNATVVFETAEQFESYVKALMHYDKFLATVDPKSTAANTQKCELVINAFVMYKEINDEDMRRYKSLPPWLRQYTPADLHIKVLHQGIQELKRSKMKEHYELAVRILSALITQTAFRQHKRANWYEERAKIYENLLRSPQQAAASLLEGFRSDLTETEKDHFRPRALRLARQRKANVSEEEMLALNEYAQSVRVLEKNFKCEHVYKQPIDNNSKGKLKFETWTIDGRIKEGVEDYAIRHYIESGSYTHGFHWEGRIVTTLFTLLFWDIIYSKPPGVQGIFLSYYQRYPLDFFSESFYANRKPLIDERLKEIAQSDIENTLKTMKIAWNNKPEGELSAISVSIEWDNIRMVCSCLGPISLAAICRRLAMNYRYAHSGFPDLTLWNVDTNEIKFVEVKSDADKPSIKQMQWMHYLLENRIDTQFCYVGVNTERSRARPKNDNSETFDFPLDIELKQDNFVEDLESLKEEDFLEVMSH